MLFGLEVLIEEIHQFLLLALVFFLLNLLRNLLVVLQVLIHLLQEVHLLPIGLLLLWGLVFQQVLVPEFFDGVFPGVQSIVVIYLIHYVLNYVAVPLAIFLPSLVLPFSFTRLGVKSIVIFRGVSGVPIGGTNGHLHQSRDDHNFHPIITGFQIEDIT